jgi:hypothetical protein
VVFTILQTQKRKFEIENGEALNEVNPKSEIKNTTFYHPGLLIDGLIY